MKIITFYSFKGGVGRSLAVANLGHILAESKERRILIVDFDLEAPGLSLMPCFKPEKSKSNDGLFEFIKSYQDGKKPNITRYIRFLDGYNHHLMLMPAGNLQHGFNPNDIRFRDLLKRRGAMNFIDYFKQQLESLKIHYVLVDSRTGLTEISGLCTIALPDIVIILTGLNCQNLEGTKWVISNITTDKTKQKDLFVVFSPVPDFEEQLKKDRMKEAIGYLGKSYMPKISLSYHPRLSMIEELFTVEWPNTGLSYNYHSLAKFISKRNSDDIESLLEKEKQPRDLPGVVKGHKEELAIKMKRREILNKALKLYPESTRVNYSFGKFMFNEKNYSKAERYLRKAVNRPDASWQAHDVFIHCLLLQGKGKEIASHFQKIHSSIARQIKSGIYPDSIYTDLFLMPGELQLNVLEEIQEQKIDKIASEIFLRERLAIVDKWLQYRPDNLMALRIKTNTMLFLYYPTKDKKVLLKTIQICKKADAIEKNVEAYNWSCALALLGRRKEALFKLKIAIKNKTWLKEHARKDRDWEAYWNDEEFKKITSPKKSKKGKK